MQAYSPTISLLLGALLAAGAVGCDQKAAGPQVRPPPPVSVSHPIRKKIKDFDEYDGRIDSVHSVEVRARVAGYLTHVAFSEGQEVKDGDVLFQIDDRPYKAELDRANAAKAVSEAELALAQAKLVRMEEALKTSAVSEVEVIEQRAQKARAEAKIAGDVAAIEQAALDLEFSTIKAPVEGKVGRALVTKGNLVTLGATDQNLLTTIESMDPIYVLFDVDERAMQRYFEDARKRLGIAPGQELPKLADQRIPVSVRLSGEERFLHEGILDFADNRVSAGTGSVLARGVLPNPDRKLRAGYYAKVRIPASEEYDALLVTELAIGTDQDQKFLLVVDEKNVVARRRVDLGRLQDDGLRVILSGVEEKDQVIVNGLQRARVGAPVAPQKVEMPTRKAPAQAPPPVSAPAPSGAGGGSPKAETPGAPQAPKTQAE